MSVGRIKEESHRDILERMLELKPEDRISIDQVRDLSPVSRAV